MCSPWSFSLSDEARKICWRTWWLFKAVRRIPGTSKLRVFHHKYPTRISGNGRSRVEKTFGHNDLFLRHDNLWLGFGLKHNRLWFGLGHAGTMTCDLDLDLRTMTWDSNVDTMRCDSDLDMQAQWLVIWTWIWGLWLETQTWTQRVVIRTRTQWLGTRTRKQWIETQTRDLGIMTHVDSDKKPRDSTTNLITTTIRYNSESLFREISPSKMFWGTDSPFLPGVETLDKTQT